VFFEALVVPGGLPLLLGPAVCHGLSRVPALGWARAWVGTWAWIGCAVVRWLEQS